MIPYLVALEAVRPTKSGRLYPRRSWPESAALGAPLPVPSCNVVSNSRELHGLSSSEAIVTTHENHPETHPTTTKTVEILPPRGPPVGPA